MNYLESLVYLESLSPTTLLPSLERVEVFMDECGRLQDRFKSIQVGGTNGKGSTVAMLDSVLRRAGMKVGRFTGPHILRWNERFHVDGCPISDERFAELATRLRALSEDFGRRRPEFGPLTWFELLTAIAFTYFAENEVEIAVLEVGLGGRWDATSVISSPLATAITNVDLDHTQILGETVLEIAREKAGIVKRGRPMVTAATGEALREIVSAANSLSAPVFHCAPPGIISALNPGSALTSEPLLSIPESSDLLDACGRLALAGSHQQLNALVALGVLVASEFGQSLDRNSQSFEGDQSELAVMSWDNLCEQSVLQVVAEGFGSVYWPGRLQSLDHLNIVLDGAHNPAGARALRRALEEAFLDRHFLFVVSCFQNKDVPSYIQELIRPNDRVIACEASSRRAVYPAAQIVELAATNRVEAVAAEGVSKALARARVERRSDELIVATGSFATVREVMLELGWQKVEDGLPYTRMSWLPAACQGRVGT